MQWIGTDAIQLCDNMKSWYLELSFPSSKKGWHKKWFYLYDPIGSLPTYSADRLGVVALPSWKGDLMNEHLKLTERLLKRITSLKNAGLTGLAGGPHIPTTSRASPEGAGHPNVGLHQSEGFIDGGGRIPSH